MNVPVVISTSLYESYRDYVDYCVINHISSDEAIARVLFLRSHNLCRPIDKLDEAMISGLIKHHFIKQGNKEFDTFDYADK